MKISVHDRRVDITVVDDDGAEAAALTALAVAEAGTDPQDCGLWLRRFVRRVCLAAHLRSDPAMLAFGWEPAGHPFLLAHDAVGFSLAQAGGLTVIAMRDGPVDVDIEPPMRLPGRVEGGPFLSEAEAVGTGFLIDPASVTLLDRDRVRGVRVRDVSMGDGAICAVAVISMSEIAISCRRVSRSNLTKIANVLR